MTNKSSSRKFHTRQLFLVAVVGFITSFQVHAELDLTGVYAGFQFADSKDEFQSAGQNNKENRGHMKIKVGKKLGEHFSAEGQLGMTTNTTTSQGIFTYGLYARAEKDMGQYKFYGLLGLGGINAYQDNVDDVTESSFSYGAGIEIFGSKHVAVTFEYLNVLDKSINGGDSTFDTLGLGFTYYFIEDKSFFNKNRNKIRSIRY